MKKVILLMNKYLNCRTLVIKPEVKCMTILREELANRGLNVEDRLTVYFDHGNGKIIIYEGFPPIWGRNMYSFRFSSTINLDVQFDENLRNLRKDRGGIKARYRHPLSGEWISDSLTL